MEGPLLTKKEDTKIDDEHNIGITVSDDSSLSPHEAENVNRCNPCTESSVWFIELVLNLVQVVAAIFVMTHAKDEHPETTLLVWIIGYTCGCVAILLHQIVNRLCSRIDKEIMVLLKNMLEFLFVGWIFPLMWICYRSSSSVYDHTQHFWLCMAFFTFTCIRYVPLNLKSLAFYLISILVIWICTILPNEIVYLVVFVAILAILRNCKRVLISHM
ncbi:PREDICTED: uncharacterized protein LOC104777555 [Camelina sativa]|uniref:Uncharacterized protein LOC104777555 n=1 Tax=Camelina sativa TaxID=90675 RepID=A0ABM0YFG1_CAMSA|nr:PREDICTED: uncharacterized protein LOC104777555 [Camelina sativa]